jgi:hypothetical protein
MFMRIRSFAVQCISVFALFVIPVIVFAHGDGQSFETVVGQYKVDIGYDVVSFRAAETVRFDFDVTTEAGGETVAFSDAWVRIVKENKTVFASGIHKPIIGKTGMTFTFPEGGEYQLSVRFQNNSQSVTEATFQVTVESSKALINEQAKARTRIMWLWIGWGVAALSLAGSVSLWYFYKPHKGV